MAWIESHQELGRHPKVKRLARMLGVSVPQAVGHLHFIWWWAMDYADDGDLSVYDQDDIADAGMWDGEPADFLKALMASGFIDDDMSLHDWFDYAGKLLDRREKNKKRMKRARATNVHDTCSAQNEHVRVECEATTPDRTVPNQSSSSDAAATSCESLLPAELLGRTAEQYWEQATGVINSTQCMSIDEYRAKGVEESVIVWAMYEARKNGKQFAYACGTLNNLVADNTLTMEKVIAREAAFREPRARGRPKKSDQDFDDMLKQVAGRLSG